jgi:hypothetical protein
MNQITPSPEVAQLIQEMPPTTHSAQEEVAQIVEEKFADQQIIVDVPSYEEDDEDLYSMKGFSL